MIKSKGVNYMKKSIGVKTAIYPSPITVVGTYDENNKANGIAVSWAGLVAADPACVAISVRPSRASHKNIIERKAFTLNIPSAKYIKQADYFGLESGRDVDKFKKTKLTPKKSDLIDAPYIDEFPMVIECELYKTVDLGSHSQFIGKIVDVKLDENCVDEKNKPIVRKIDPVAYAMIDRGYYRMGEIVGNGFNSGLEYK